MLDTVNIYMIQEILLNAEDDELATIRESTSCGSFHRAIQSHDFWRRRFMLKFGDHLGQKYFDLCNQIFYDPYEYYMYKSYGENRVNVTNNQKIDIAATHQKFFDLFKNNCNVHNTWYVRKRDRHLKILKKNTSNNSFFYEPFEIECFIFENGNVRLKGCKSPQQYHQYIQEIKNNIIINSQS